MYDGHWLAGWLPGCLAGCWLMVQHSGVQSFNTVAIVNVLDIQQSLVVPSALYKRANLIFGRSFCAWRASRTDNLLCLIQVLLAINVSNWEPRSVAIGYDSVAVYAL